MNKPFFSVIVPAHNSQNYIRKCLHSVKMQKFTDYELIVVCDNCNDQTAQVALGYTDRVIIVQHGMDGLARNAGLDAAEGEWIIFLDDDDWWIHEYVMEELHKDILTNDVDLVAFDFIWKDPPEGKPAYYHNTSRMNIAVWSKAFRRSMIGDTRFLAIPFTSDDPFMQEILRKPIKYMATGKLMYYYNYMRKGSQTEKHTRPDRSLTK